MLYTAKTLITYALQSLEGDFREITQFYFDDRTWIIRYVGADAGGGPFSDRKVLIDSNALLRVSASEGRLYANLTRMQIEKCPELKDHLPVSEQSEPAFHDYYEPKTRTQNSPGFFPYIPGPDLDADRGKPRPSDRAEDGWDRTLRSTHALTGYHVESTNGDIGHIHDFIIDDQTWTIRYLVINAHYWWPGRRTLVSTQWVKSISAEKSKVVVSIGREAVKESPEYDDHATITRDYETTLFRHYGRKGYWIDNNTDIKPPELPQSVREVEPHSSRELQL